MSQHTLLGFSALPKAFCVSLWKRVCSDWLKHIDLSVQFFFPLAKDKVVRGFKTSMGEKHYVNGSSFHFRVQENSEGTMGRRAHT